jgi:hypothetical protein
MKRALALVFLAGLLVTCSEAHAQASPSSITVSWTAPALTWAGGTAIPGGAVYGYELAWQGATSEPWLPFDSMDLPPTATSASVPVYCGNYTVTLMEVVTWNDPNAPGAMVESSPVSLTYSTGVECPPAPVSNVWTP